MNFFPSDRLYEEAARSPESYDKLLKKLRRARMVSGICMLVIGIITVGVSVPLSIRAMQVLKSPETVSLPKLGGVTVDASLIGPVAALLLIGFIQHLIFMMHCDACIKLLLFMRVQQSRTHAKPDDT